MKLKVLQVYLKLAKYLDKLLNLPRVAEALNAVLKPSPVIKIIVSSTCGASTAGQTWYYPDGESIIELSSWILYDFEEAKKVIRHEFAHVVQCYCRYEGGMHGRGFNKALKVVSARKWRTDKHWIVTQGIEEARRKHHPKVRVLLE